MDITYLNELEPMDFYEAVIELSDRDSVPEIRREYSTWVSKPCMGCITRR